MSELQMGRSTATAVLEGQAGAGAPSGRRDQKRSSLHPLVLSFFLFLAVRACPGIAGTLWSFAVEVPAEMGNIEQVLDHAMAAGNAGDAQALFALFASEDRDPELLADLEEFVGGYNHVLFAGYQKLSVSGWTVNRGTNTTVEVNGAIAYDEGYVGEFAAVLVKEDGAWKLESLSINVPVGKPGGFQATRQA